MQDLGVYYVKVHNSANFIFTVSDFSGLLSKERQLELLAALQKVLQMNF